MTPDTITVLYVDDETSLHDLVADFFEREDSRLTVIAESSAEDGLERITRDAVDCIVSDYEMPGTNGLEFLEAVRDEYPDLPFVLYTGTGSEEIAERAINAGVDGYYQKQAGTGQYAVLANQVTTLVEKQTAERRLDQVIRDRHVADGGVDLDDGAETVGRENAIGTTVVREVAAREGTDPIDLTPPLCEVIDAEALETLFPRDPENGERGADSVTFTYLGYTVTVSDDRQVTIAE